MADSTEAWAPPAQAARQPKRRSNSKFIIAGLVLAAAVAYLIFSGAQAQGVYYLTVTEAAAGVGGSSQMRVAGRVVDGSIERDPRTLETTFVIADQENASATLPVFYKGVVPDGFVPGADVIIEGKLVSGQPFEAKQIMTQCASKYEPADAARK